MSRIALVAVCALLAAGCSDGGGGLDNASTESKSGESQGSTTALLTSIEVTKEDGYDRAVFEFANHVPGYDVGYVERPIVADGSGDEVAVQGAAVLQVRLEPALDADLTKEDAPRTYFGPTRFSPDAQTIVELVRTGGFEAVLTWTVGLKEKAPFAVSTLTDPPRVVVDVAAD